MKAVWYERNGPAREVLQCGDLPDPVPGTGEVLVRVHASGVNPSDWKTRSGSRPMVAPRIIPHSDGAGVIERVGPAVDPSRVGERVWIWNGQWKRPFGTAATYIALPSGQAVRLPKGTTFEADACLGISALTAHRAVTIDVSPQGQSVLVLGGAGAVGHYAIEFARPARGCADHCHSELGGEGRARQSSRRRRGHQLQSERRSGPGAGDYRRSRRRSHRRSGYRGECYDRPEDHCARWALRGLRFKRCSGLF